MLMGLIETTISCIQKIGVNKLSSKELTISSIRLWSSMWFWCFGSNTVNQQVISLQFYSSLIFIVVEKNEA